MKKLALSALAFAVLLTAGCAAWRVGDEPIVRWGERVRVVNNLKHTVLITYRPWGEEGSLQMEPGQEGVIAGIRAHEFLVAQVIDGNEAVIGTTDYRIRPMASGRPQLWRITNYRALR